MTNVTQSEEIIENFSKSLGKDSAYPYAFGYAWGMLTTRQRQLLMAVSVEMKNATTK